MSKMTESELKAILSAEIADSIGHIGGELSEQRRKALDYYLGQPFGNEIEGRSKVVSTDVSDTIEWILPSLLRIFTAGDDVVRYEPTGPEDEEVARQATGYANWIFNRDNPGFYALAGAQQLRGIGQNKVDRFFWNDVNQSHLHRISSAVDPVNKLYVVSYPSAASVNGTPDKLLIYSWQTDRWSRAEQPLALLHQGASQASYTLEGLDSISTNLDALPFSLDSRAWTGAGRLLLGGFSIANRAGFFSGQPMAAVVDTGESQLLEGSRTLVRGVRPLADGGTPSVALGYRNRLSDEVQWGPDVAQNDRGACPQRASARYFRARLKIRAGQSWTHLQGIDEIDAAPAGRQ